VSTKDIGHEMAPRNENEGSKGQSEKEKNWKNR